MIINTSVGATKELEDGSVTTSKIANGAITTDKLATNSVTNSKIQDGTIQKSKLSFTIPEVDTSNFLPLTGGTVTGVTTFSGGIKLTNLFTEINSADVITRDSNGSLSFANLNYLANKLGVKNISFGSYVGTGTYGTNDPNTLTFPFAPNLVWFCCRLNSSKRVGIFANTPFLDMGIASNNYSEDGSAFFEGNIASKIKKSNDGKTLYWYNVSSASAQANTNGYTYYYVAF